MRSRISKWKFVGLRSWRRTYRPNKPWISVATTVASEEFISSLYGCQGGCKPIEVVWFVYSLEVNQEVREFYRVNVIWDFYLTVSVRTSISSRLIFFSPYTHFAPFLIRTSLPKFWTTRSVVIALRGTHLNALYMLRHYDLNNEAQPWCGVERRGRSF